MSSPRSALTESVARWAPPFFGVVLVGVGVALLSHGWAYYRLPLVQRFDHAELRELAPSGLVGQGYGVAGTALVAANLVYLVRRRWSSVPLGSMRFWLDLHVFTGLAGAMMIVFHSAFQLRNSLATVASIALLVVVLTGLLGRFVMLIRPQIQRAAVRENLELLERLSPGLGAAISAALSQRKVKTFEVTPSIFQILATFPEWLREIHERDLLIQGISKKAKVPRSNAMDASAELWRAVGTTQRLARLEVQSVAGEYFLQSWRGLHRFASVLMLLAAAIHIGVAWYYGYRWIFSE